jgi:tRNA A37 methylthiotransferase MiaB
VTPQEKADRRQRLVAASEATGVKHTARFVGRTMRVLLEGKVGRDGLLEGLTDNYLSVKLAGSAGLCRSLQWVRLDEVQGKTLFGELAAGPEADRLRLAMV